MPQYFILNEAKKSKDGKICYRGQLTFIAELCDDDGDPGGGGGDGGGGGGGGGGDGTPPPFRIEFPSRPNEVVWVYEDGTPDWAIAGAKAVGHEVIHHRDWFPHKPI